MRLHFVVEGQTEETFVRDILAPELGASNIFCDVHRITTGRRKKVVYRGGFVEYLHLRRDLEMWTRQDGATDSWFTTMVDFYKLPPTFPGFEESQNLRDPYRRVSLLESKFKEDIDYRRFIPYIQLHEFESLLFAEPSGFLTAFPDLDTEIAALEAVRNAVASPELIDEGPDTHPSKQVCRIIPRYTKTVSGPLIARHIGLPTLRRECQHFADWITTILACETGTTA